MRSNTPRRGAVAAAWFLLCVAAVGGAEAQRPRRLAPPPGPELRVRPPMARTGGSTMTATTQFVYILRGNTLTALDARTLREVVRRELGPSMSPFRAREPVAPPILEPPPPPAPPSRRAPAPSRPPRAVPPPPGVPGVNAPFTPAPPPLPEPFPQGGGLFTEEGMSLHSPGGSAAAITATERYVYVLRGRMLYSFDARTLREVARVELPDVMRQAPGGLEPLPEPPAP
jgi:hypothetical protein